MTHRGILTPKNNYVDEINQFLINRFPRKEVLYHSFDKTKNPSQEGEHEDFINSLTANGLPTHVLVIKLNCPLYLKVYAMGHILYHRFNKNIIDCEITIWYNRAQRVFLPIIPLQPLEIENFPIAFTRTQFPI